VFLRIIQIMKGWWGAVGGRFDQTMVHHVPNYKTA